jgi:hypothetical protein
VKLPLKNNTLTLPEELISEYHLGPELNIDLRKDGLLIRATKAPRAGWSKSFSRYLPEDLNGLDIVNEADETDWTW